MNEVRQLNVADGEVRGEQQPRRVNHYLKRAARQTRLQYEPDEHELHPKPKRERLAVELADAAKAEVKSQSTQVAAFKAGERPPLKFKGTVVVTAAEEEDLAGETEDPSPAETNMTSTPTAAHEKAAATQAAVEKATAESKAEAERHLHVKDTSGQSRRKQPAKPQSTKNSQSAGQHLSVVSDEPAIEHGSATDETTGRRRTLLQRPGVIGMQRPEATARAAASAETPMTATVEPSDSEPTPSQSLTGVSVAVFGIATLITFALLGAEITVVSTVSGSEIDYQFSIGQLVDNLMSLKEALFAHAGNSR